MTRYHVRPAGIVLAAVHSGRVVHLVRGSRPPPRRPPRWRWRLVVMMVGMMALGMGGCFL